LHAPATILACDAGKDVYVEKPAAHNIREGRLMVDAARRNNRIVQVGTQARSRPSTMQAIALANSGQIGKVIMAKAWNTQLRETSATKMIRKFPTAWTIVARTGRNVQFAQETETIPGDAAANVHVKRAYRTHWSTPKGV
jgi:predicted dehydrogenase